MLPEFLFMPTDLTLSCIVCSYFLHAPSEFKYAF